MAQEANGGGATAVHVLVVPFPAQGHIYAQHIHRALRSSSPADSRTRALRPARRVLAVRCLRHRRAPLSVPSDAYAC
uniref:Uncharacterized protein n=1 Tax=Oryza brachyantha TaxID=4533 RepID=J3N2A1_ORYBR